jgi:Lactoylglutathione lyase and related lyases
LHACRSTLEDPTKAVEQAKEKGAEVIREAGPMSAGDTILAFLKDPDGYEIELLSKTFK